MAAMEHKIIGPGPYRATKLWNDTIELFRDRMPLRRHRVHFKIYDNCFSALEAIVCLHDLLQDNPNFGPDVTRNQTIQLLKKFKKNHVIEDMKGRWGQEDFEDNGYLYRFPPSSPLKPYPQRPNYRTGGVPRFPGWSDYEAITSKDPAGIKPVVMNSDLWYKRHSIAIGEVPACRLVQRRALTDSNVEEIWKTMTLNHLQKILGLDSMDDVLDSKFVNPKHIIYNVYNTNKQGVVILDDKSKELPHWLLSAMKCLANWPSSTDLNRPMYLGFERDVFKTIADFHSQMKEPLLTFQLFDVFVSVLVKLNVLILASLHLAWHPKFCMLSLASVNLALHCFFRCRKGLGQICCSLLCYFSSRLLHAALSGFVSKPLQKNQTRKSTLHALKNSDKNEMNFSLNSSASIEDLMLSLSRKTLPECFKRDRPPLQAINFNPTFLDRRTIKLSQHRSSRSTNEFGSLQQDKRNLSSTRKCSTSDTHFAFMKESRHMKKHHFGSVQREKRKHTATQLPTSMNIGVDNACEKQNVCCKMNRGQSLQSLREIRNAAVNPLFSTYSYFSIENLPDIDQLEEKPILNYFTSVGNFPAKLESKRLPLGENGNRTPSECYLPTLYNKCSSTPKTQSSHCKSCKDEHCKGFRSKVSDKNTSVNEHLILSPYQYFGRPGKLSPLPSSHSFSPSPNIQRRLNRAMLSRMDDSKSPPHSYTTPRIRSYSVSGPESRNIAKNIGFTSKSVRKCHSMSSLLQKRQVAVEALQLCCLLLPPENRRKFQLLMRMMAMICQNREIPALCENVGTRMLMVQTFSRCILRSKDEVDLDELLASRLVTLMIDNYQEILKIPVALQTMVEDHVAHLRRVQIKYPGADMDATIAPHSFCRQISNNEYEYEYQKANDAQDPLATLLEEIIMNAKLSTKDRKKKLKQFQKSYPEAYKKRFPTPESEAALFHDKVKRRPHLMLFSLRNAFQPFQRTRSFRL